jgi:L-ascorbate metabolism protein UlaG (beta-lactamase superfamily)
VKDASVTHIGGPTALVEVGGWRILTDPTFDDPGRRYAFGWGTSSRKLAGPAIAASDVWPIDAVLLTHDHLDPTERALLPSAGVVVTTASGAERLGGAARGLAPWESTRLEQPGRPAIEVTATPCRHGPPLSHPLVGDVIGFALRCSRPRRRASVSASGGCRSVSASSWTEPQTTAAKRSRVSAKSSSPGRRHRSRLMTSTSIGPS